MKLKPLVVACAALCSTGAFAAATPITCVEDSLLNVINTCAPEVTFFIGGASAPSAALNATLTAGAGIFDTTKIRGKITNTALTTSGNGNSVGYIGYGAVGTPYAGKRVLVVYNKANGSAAGVATLLTGKGGNGEENTIYTAGVKSLSKGIAGTCTVTTESTGGSLGVAACATEAPVKSKWGVDAQKSLHMAISDVYPNEAAPDYAVAAKINWKKDKFPAEAVAMQGFGVIVNAKLYSAMIAKQVADGRLPTSCLSSENVSSDPQVITAACQPNIDRAVYASLITGKSTDSSLLTGTAEPIKLFRRVSSSGTQATSNTFFLNQAGYNKKAELSTYVAPIGAGVVGSLTVTEGSTTGDVINNLSAETVDHAIGYASLENTYSMTKASSKLKGALFVKVDGMSPNFTAAGTLDSKARAGLQAGYPVAFELVTVKSSVYTTPSVNHEDIYQKVVAGLKDPAQNLAGIAYIGSADAAKNTGFTHGGGNYKPLSKQ